MGAAGEPGQLPSEEEPGDDGWHVEGSFRGDAGEADYLDWRVNLASRERALLMLFLFPEVGPQDAPTRLRVGSHRTVARLLARRGDDGLEMLPLSLRAAGLTEGLPVAFATGRPGDVRLCHPFLVHAAQPHHGTAPVEVAIRAALAQRE